MREKIKSYFDKRNNFLIIFFLIFVRMISQNSELQQIKYYLDSNQVLFNQFSADNVYKKIIDIYDNVFNQKLSDGKKDYVFHLTYYQNNNEYRYYLQIENKVKFLNDDEKNHMEIYYNNYCPNNESFDNGVIINYSAIYDLISKDTINKHIITTKPMNKRYKVWVSMCPRSPGKKKSIEMFKSKIYSQYQLLIFKNKIREFEFYFILPPDRKYSLRYKIKRTKL